MNKMIPLVTLCLSSFILVSCDSLSDTFGLKHNSPDEWTVPNTPPLELPPDYNLVPPQPGAEPTRYEAPVAKAQRQLGDPCAVNSSSEMEKSIVAQSAADTLPDANIRTKVDCEAVNEASTLEKLKNLPRRAMENIMGGEDECAEDVKVGA